MSSERHARIGELFAAVCDLEPEARDALLERECADDPEFRGEVEALIGFEVRHADFLEGRAELATEEEKEEELPDAIGDYRIVRWIGAGGMGLVYEAEQDSPRRRVALKLIAGALATPAVLRRFQLEGEALGRLQHPAIAQIYSVEGGGGQPFFTMELIEGLPIGDYAARARLDWRATLELVAAIADGVEHAHQRGVIHRDLKPGNILVTADGAPKILDFGVARLTDADVRGATLETHAGQIIGTLGYMSPEQASGDPANLDTRSDVYALGVLLFELLTGRLPFDIDGKPLPAALVMLLEQEPLRLLASIGAGTAAPDADVETIVGKALEKDKERRYASAHAFAEDLRRVLRREPIVARPATTLYTLKKFAQRNRVLVASAVLLVASLTAGLVTSSVLYGREQEARIELQVALERALDAESAARIAEGEAREEALTANRTTDLLVSIFQLNQAERARGETITAREILDQAADTVGATLMEEPRVRARLLSVLGVVYRNLGLYPRAKAQFEEALRVRRDELGPRARPTLETLSDLAVLLWREGDYEASLALHREALEGLEALLGPNDLELADRFNNFGASLAAVGDDEGARAAFERALAIYAANPDSDPLLRAQMSQNLAVLQRRGGDLEAARATLVRLLAERTELSGENDPEVALIHVNLGHVLADLGEFEAALEQHQAALAITEKVRAPDHPAVATELGALAGSLLQLERFAEARAAIERALPIIEASVGAEHPQYGLQLFNLAGAHEGEGRRAEALGLYERAHAIFARALGAEHSFTVAAENERTRLRDEQAEAGSQGH